jgi:hypothetical protein
MAQRVPNLLKVKPPLLLKPLLLQMYLTKFPLPNLLDRTLTSEKGTENKKPQTPREPRERKQRGPPEDGVPSKTKVMVANLPYDLKEDRVRFTLPHICSNLLASSDMLERLSHTLDLSIRVGNI